MAIVLKPWQVGWQEAGYRFVDLGNEEQPLMTRSCRSEESRSSSRVFGDCSSRLAPPRPRLCCLGHAEVTTRGEQAGRAGGETPLAAAGGSGSALPSWAQPGPAPPLPSRARPLHRCRGRPAPPRPRRERAGSAPVATPAPALPEPAGGAGAGHGRPDGQKNRRTEGQKDGRVGRTAAFRRSCAALARPGSSGAAAPARRCRAASIPPSLRAAAEVSGGHGRGPCSVSGGGARAEPEPEAKFGGRSRR